jgi:copper chaperone CopZ
MTCEHCVASVTEEVGEIAGVRNVVVDLASGSLAFEAEQPIARETVEAAVREAGYELG